jgi:membrane associated rhomboid family serine protease
VWGGEETQRALVYDPHHREQLWRFLTYMLLHSNSLHLALNVTIQCLLAAPLEHEQGHLRTSLVYLGGVLGGRIKVSFGSVSLQCVESHKYDRLMVLSAVHYDRSSPTFQRN